jgi:site-specific recombinase XerD
MLEHFFAGAPTLARLRTGPTGPFADGFADALRNAGYARGTARGYVRAAAHLSTWMQGEGLAIAALDERVLVGFGRHLRHCACLRRNRGRYADAIAGARHFLAHVRARGLVAVPPVSAGHTLPAVLEHFEEWMRGHRGISERTLQGYRPILLDLLRRVGEPERFTAAPLRQFVLDRAAPRGPSYAKTVTKAVRMFLRYAASHGLAETRLIDTIPTIAHWRLASLPVYLSPADVERLVHAPDPATPVGLRDRAMLLLLARLGLRAGDLIALRLHDLDWQAGTLSVTGKGRRVARLPLPQDAGDALLAYLTTGRPASGDDHVFLRSRAPVRALRHQVTVAEAVHRAAARAGVRLPRGGGHVLRHSLATALVRGGVPLPAIGMMLRHRSAETTAYYAKVDVPMLRRVARGWPLEVPPC